MGRGRAPCCEKVGLKKGSWTPAEDMRLMAYIQKYGHGNWRALPKQAGLLRCGKSCRLRWINYLRPDIKRGNFTKEEEDAIIKLHELLGNKWSKIASRLPGRTDNEIKNVWNTHLKKRLVSKQEQTTNSAEKLKESPSSSSSDSSISYCNQSDDSREVAHGASGPGTNKDTSEVCNSPEKERKEDSDEIIEIPIEPNLDIWDMLEEGSSQSPISTNNNDMNIWDEHFNKHLLEGLEGLEGPEVLIDERRDTSSSSSYDSNATCYNLGEMASQLVSYEANDISPKNNQIHSDQMPENELWKMLDDDSCLFGSDHVVDPMGDELGIPKNPITSEEESTMECENNKWISYLEKELDLWGANEQSPMEDAVEPSLSSLQEQGEILLDVGMDPVTCYFQKRPSSPSPFCL